MPDKPSRGCKEYPNCPNKAANGSLYCETHKQLEKKDVVEYERNRETATRRGYDRRWQKIRRITLSRFPLCVCNRPASEVHHKDGNPKNNAPDNLQSLCKPCHSAITDRMQGRNKTMITPGGV